MTKTQLQQIIREEIQSLLKSKVNEASDKDFDKFADAVEDVIPLDDPNHDKLLDAVSTAYYDGDISARPFEPGSYYKQVLGIAKKLNLA